MKANLTYAAQIPGGLLKNGVRIQDVELRPLNGEDEVFLLEGGELLSSPARETALLTQCVVRFGSEVPATKAVVRSLSVGDREALLLHLRLLTFGDRMPCVLSCPQKNCCEKMNLDLFVKSLLVKPYEEWREWHDVSLSVCGKDNQVRLRVPTGVDLELLSSCAPASPVMAEMLLLERCARVAPSDGEGGQHVDSLSPALIDAIGRELSRLDPQAEILLSMKCAACGRDFTAEFDAGAYFYQELRGHIAYLYREVHTIARSYHWSESDILGMTPKNRSIYLGLLAGEGSLA
jgi:hypothetical protein